MAGLAEAVLQTKVLVISSVSDTGGAANQAAELHVALQPLAEVVWLRKDDYSALVQDQSQVTELATWLEGKMEGMKADRHLVVLIDDVSSWGQGVALQLMHVEHLLDKYPNLHLVYFSRDKSFSTTIAASKPGQVQVYSQDKVPGFGTKGSVGDAAPSAPPAPEGVAPGWAAAPQADLGPPGDPTALRRLSGQLRAIFGAELGVVAREVGWSLTPDGSLWAQHSEDEVKGRLVDALVVTVLMLLKALEGQDLTAVRSKLERLDSDWVVVPSEEKPVEQKRGKRGGKSSAKSKEEEPKVDEGKKERLVRALLRRALEERKEGSELEWAYEELWEVVGSNWEEDLAKG